MLKLDWFQVGLSECNDTLICYIIGKLELEKQGKSRFYVGMNFSSEGSLSYIPKKGCKNDFATLQLTGTFFQREDSEAILQEVLNALYEWEVAINPQRIDVRYDFKCNEDWKTTTGEVYKYDFEKCKIRDEETRLPCGYHLNRKGKSTGFWAGKGDKRFRLYDKAEEQSIKKGVKGEEVWWRYEVQLRGDVLKTAMSTSDTYCLPFYTLTVGSFLNGSQLPITSNNITNKINETLVEVGNLPKPKTEKATVEKKFLQYQRDIEKRTLQLVKACRKLNQKYIQPGNPDQKEYELTPELLSWVTC